MYSALRPVFKLKPVMLAGGTKRRKLLRIAEKPDPERAQRFPAVLAEIRRLENVRRAAALFRSHPSPPAPSDTIAFIRRLMGAGGPAG